MAQHGCKVTATDLEPDAQTAAGWSQTNQHSAQLSDLNERGICDADTFEAQVGFVRRALRLKCSRWPYWGACGWSG